MATDRPTVKWATITPAEASRLLETQLSNRRLNMRRVNSAAEDIRSGRWVENGETVKISHKGNLMDGQHRLAAIVKAGKEISTLVVSGIPESAMASIDQGRARSSSDVLGLLGVNNAMEAASVARSLWEMEKFCTLGARVYPQRSEIVRIYRKYSDEIQDALLMARRLKAGHRRLVPGSPAAVAYILISRKSKRGDAFFQALADDDKAAPIQALRRVVRNAINARKNLRAEKLVPLILKAYNAWATGQKIDVLGYRIGEAFPEVSVK